MSRLGLRMFFRLFSTNTNHSRHLLMAASL